MKIQRLFLRNVRNIRTLDLDFRGPVTGKPMSRIVLAGANGSGKTTILESIFGLLEAIEKQKLQGLVSWDPFEASRLQLFFDVDFPNEPHSLLTIGFGQSTEEEDFSLFTNTSLAEQARLGGRIGNYEGIIASRLPQNTSRFYFDELADSIQKAREIGASSVGSIIYFPHTRYLPTVKMDKLDLVQPKYLWAYRYTPSDRWDESVEKYLFWLNYLDLEDRGKNMPANRFSQATEVVNKILDGKRIARVEKGRVVIDTKEGETHGLDDLSSGEKQLALLLIDISRRIVPGSVILIDEPEISLHATWQRGLMAALDRIIEQYDAQVILATHSLEIATSVMPHEVISLNDLGLSLGKWEPEKEALS